ncbi:MAG: SufD family Fe-S cluster assembly protein [Paracoccus sp. (in: a-proteobacteria)]|nr:SufD family Fe-S cluster assembly protein [Paracoccus sp. (in: a-proteobacteria)]
MADGAELETADAATEARLGAAKAPKGGFTAAARDDAAARLRAMGLPGRRDEYWRYTSPAPFNAPDAEPLPIAHSSPDSPLFRDIDALSLVFIDGRFEPGMSDKPGMEGVEISTLAEADKSGDHWAAEYYGALEKAGQKHVARPFAALNTATARDGVLIRVTGRPARPIHIIHHRQSEDDDVVCHHVIVVEPGAALTLLETGMAGARSNAMVEADVKAGGALHLISAHRAGYQRLALSHIFARVAEKALFKAFTLSVNGTVMRHEGVIEMVGDDGIAHIAAAVLGDGDRGPFHHDDTVFITHDAENCESRQVFKKVLKNGATGVFQGKILVQPGAQKTDGYQISQALLLDEDSQFLAKPELEIYADDVQCSHGSTTGAIDETALFYLRSRGVPRDRAIVLMVLSFLADALEEIDDETLRAQVSDRLEAWLTRRAKI